MMYIIGKDKIVMRIKFYTNLINKYAINVSSLTHPNWFGAEFSVCSTKKKLVGTAFSMTVGFSWSFICSSRKLSSGKLKKLQYVLLFFLIYHVQLMDPHGILGK